MTPERAEQCKCEFWRKSYEYMWHHAENLTKDRDLLNRQMVEWRGTIRETGHDGAREIVQAYKAKCAEVFKLRAMLARVQSNLSALDISELAQDEEAVTLTRTLNRLEGFLNLQRKQP